MVIYAGRPDWQAARDLRKDSLGPFSDHLRPQNWGHYATPVLGPALTNFKRAAPKLGPPNDPNSGVKNLSTKSASSGGPETLEKLVATPTCSPCYATMGIAGYCGRPCRYCGRDPKIGVSGETGCYISALMFSGFFLTPNLFHATSVLPKGS